MIRNAIARLIVDDPDAAIAFYCRALGARVGDRYVVDDVVVHAVVEVDEAVFTLAAEVAEWGLLSPLSVGGSSSLITLNVGDAPAVGAAMVLAGAEVLVPIVDRPYGRCEGRVRDPFGHLWIPSHPLDGSVAPTVRRIVPDFTTNDLDRSVEFYRGVFGLEVVMDIDWVVTLAAPGHPRRQITLIRRDATALIEAEVSIEVDDLDVVWDRVVKYGAEVVYPRQVEPWGVERFFVRDPAGHIINVLCHRAAGG